MHGRTPESGQDTAMTLEAFADTVVPGEKRWPDDHAIAGAAAGGGAVAAGALEVLRSPEAGLSEGLDGLAQALNSQAARYAAEIGARLAREVPAFVALGYSDRVELVNRLTAPGHPAREIWVGVVVFCAIAFDTAPHLHTVEAIDAGHPGLTAVGIRPPDPDGLWRFPAYTYGRPLANLHPNTTASGSPE